MIKSTCTKVLFRIIHGSKIKYTKKCYVHIIMLKKKLLHYMDGLLSIMFDKEETTKRTNQWFFHIEDFNKEYIIQPYIVTISKNT